MIFSSLVVAALLSAGSHALSEDYNVWRKHFGTSAAKNHKGKADRKESITIHGSPTASGWPSKIPPMGKGDNLGVGGRKKKTGGTTHEDSWETSQ